MDVWIVEQGGRTLCHCGAERDAVAMVGLGRGRTYRKLKVVSPQTIDVDVVVQGELPGQLGLPVGRDRIEGGEAERLGAGEGAPLRCAGNV